LQDFFLYDIIKSSKKQGDFAMQKVKEILKKFWSKTTVAFLIGALASAVGLTLNPATQEALACLLGATGCK